MRCPSYAKKILADMPLSAPLDMVRHSVSINSAAEGVDDTKLRNLCNSCARRVFAHCAQTIVPRTQYPLGTGQSAYTFKNIHVRALWLRGPIACVGVSETGQERDSFSRAHQIQCEARATSLQTADDRAMRLSSDAAPRRTANGASGTSAVTGEPTKKGKV